MQSPWGDTEYKNADFETINKLAYFDYQRSKIYLRTNKKVNKAIKLAKKIQSNINSVNKIIKINPGECPVCNGHDLKIKIIRNKTHIDLKFTSGGIKKWIVKFEGGSFRCNHCKAIFIPEKYRSILTHRYSHKYGHNLIVWTINNYVTYRISFKKIAQMLLELYGIQISDFSVPNFRSAVCKEYQKTFEEIKQSVISGQLVHIDETPANVQNISGGYVSGRLHEKSFGNKGIG